MKGKGKKIIITVEELDVKPHKICQEMISHFNKIPT